MKLKAYALHSLFEAEKIRVDGNLNLALQRIDEQMNIRAENNIQLGIAEAKRIDAIRAVDVNAVSISNERSAAQAIVLANQVASSAEALRALVAATAVQQAQQLSTLTTQLTDRLTALEKSQYENSGSGAGRRDMYGWIFGAIIGLAGVIGVLFAIFHH
jgi:hypothetical protein